MYMYYIKFNIEEIFCAMPRTYIYWMIIGLMLGSDAVAEGQQPDHSDPKALATADQVMAAMGGKTNWDNTRYLRFTFFGFRTHYWDKWTGRYRVEWKSREGDAYVVLMNLNTKEGDVYVNGTGVEGEEMQSLLDRAEGAWINDTYWLLMPYKLKDPGVILKYDEEETIDGVVYDKLHLSFKDVGRTSGDEYWAYVNRETHLMDKWMYLLQPNKEGKRRRGEARWNNWQQYGNIMLSPERKRPDGQKNLLENIAVFETMEGTVFTSPEPVSMP